MPQHSHHTISMALLTALILFFNAAAHSEIVRRSDTPWPDAPDTSRFGWDVSINGNEMLVSAPHAEDAEIGAAYLYEWDGTSWIERRKIVPENDTDENWCCYKVDFNEDFIVLAAPEADFNILDETGYLYIYSRTDDAPVEYPRHISPLGRDGGHYGAEIDLHEDRLIVSEPGGDQARAYIKEYDYVNDGWHITHMLRNEVGYFIHPSGVAIHGDNAVVVRDDLGAYVYQRNETEWVLQQTLEIEDATADRLSVTMEDDIIAIGSPDERVAGEERIAGQLHIYEQLDGEWQEVATFGPDYALPDMEFGRDVDMQDGLLIVRESRDQGREHLFSKNENNEWVRRAVTPFYTRPSFREEVRVSARFVAKGATTDEIAYVSVDPMDLWLEAHAVPEPADDDDGSDNDDSGNGDDGDDGNGNGGDDDSGGNNDDDTGDDAGNDDPDEGNGDDTGDDNGDDTDDDTGGDDSDDDSDTGGDNPGVGTGGDEPPAAGGGGGSIGAFLLMPLAFPGLFNLGGRMRKLSSEGVWNARRADNPGRH